MHFVIISVVPPLKSHRHTVLKNQARRYPLPVCPHTSLIILSDRRQHEKRRTLAGCAFYIEAIIIYIIY